MRSRHSILGIVLTACLLTACKPGFDISLASEGEVIPNPQFVIAPVDAPQARPEYHTVQLLDSETLEVLWHLRAAPFGVDASSSTLTYGETPDGFEVVVLPTVLEPNRPYVLIVTGAPRGQLRFRVTDDGRVISQT